jgi:hypothetical protein
MCNRHHHHRNHNLRPRPARKKQSPQQFAKQAAAVDALVRWTKQT